MQLHERPVYLRDALGSRKELGFIRSEVGGAENSTSVGSIPLVVLPLNCLTNEAYNYRCFVLCLFVRCMRILHQNYCPKRPRAIGIDPD